MGSCVFNGRKYTLIFNEQLLNLESLNNALKAVVSNTLKKKTFTFSTPQSVALFMLYIRIPSYSSISFNSSTQSPKTKFFVNNNENSIIYLIQFLMHYSCSKQVMPKHLNVEFFIFFIFVYLHHTQDLAGFHVITIWYALLI